MNDRVYLGRRRAMTVEDWLARGWTQTEAERYAQRRDTTVEVLVADARRGPAAAALRAPLPHRVRMGLSR